MDMVISGTNHEDVAEPDAMASGAAGTGKEETRVQRPQCRPAAAGKNPGIAIGSYRPRRPFARDRGGTVLPETPVPVLADTGSREKDGSIDLIFALFERDERIRRDWSGRWAGWKRDWTGSESGGGPDATETGGNYSGRSPSISSRISSCSGSRICGEELEGVAVKRTQRHFYTVRIRHPAGEVRDQSERAAEKRGGER